MSWLVGKRTGENATTFAKDLRARVEGSPLLYSDGLKHYIEAIEEAFGIDVRYGQLVKEYKRRGDGGDDPYVGCQRTVIRGKVEPKEISTSLIERQNLTTRQESRRFGRKTLGHSKVLRNHVAAVGLAYAAYNMARVHSTLRVTPAMAIGVTDHVWSVAELVEAALAEPVPQAPTPVEPERPRQDRFQLLLPGMQPGLRVVRGGRR